MSLLTESRPAIDAVSRHEGCSCPSPAASPFSTELLSPRRTTGSLSKKPRHSRTRSNCRPLLAVSSERRRPDLWRSPKSAGPWHCGRIKVHSSRWATMQGAITQDSFSLAARAAISCSLRIFPTRHRKALSPRRIRWRRARKRAGAGVGEALPPLVSARPRQWGCDLYAAGDERQQCSRALPGDRVPVEMAA